MEDARGEQRTFQIAFEDDSFSAAGRAVLVVSDSLGVARAVGGETFFGKLGLGAGGGRNLEIPVHRRVCWCGGEGGAKRREG